MRFGLITVLSRAEFTGRKVRWNVRCACGVEKRVRGDYLVAGRAKSCGCSQQRFKTSKMEKKFGLVNQRFGRLLVLWRAPREGRVSRSMMWECKCDCGKLTTVSANSLRGGTTQSCGCLLNGIWLPQGQAARNTLLRRYQRNAAARGLTWVLPDVDFDKLVAGTCCYCGAVPRQVCRAKNCNGVFVYNGIDRKDNSLGYTTDNSVTCCFICNSMKRTMTTSAFIAHLRRVLGYFDNKKATEAAA